MSVFNWRDQPSKTKLTPVHIPRLHNGLITPEPRRGNIVLPADPQACSDKTAKITGKTPGHLRAKT